MMQRVSLRFTMACLVVAAFPAPWASAGGEADGKGGVAVDPAEVAVLRSEMSYCQVRAIDGKRRPLAENEWAFVADRHLLHLACQVRAGRGRSVVNVIDRRFEMPFSITRSWEFEQDLVFEPEPGGRYLVKDFVDAADQEYVWIEDVEESQVVSGRRPEVFEGPDRYSDEEIAEAIASLGTGSTLVVSYKAPKKPVKRLEVRIKNKVVLETPGNEDVHVRIPMAPGFYVVKVAVENDKEHADYSSVLDLELEPGGTRTLTVKGKAWGRSPARIR